MNSLLTEQIFIPFKLNKTNVIDIRLGAALDFVGDGWHVCLKSFSIDRKWSLSSEKITIIWTNGYKTELTPLNTSSLTDVEKIIDELFSQKIRAKRHVAQQMRNLKRQKRDDDIFDQITFNDESSESEKEEEEREVTPPPSVMLFDPDKLDARNSDEKPQKEVTPPPGMFPPSPPRPPRVHEINEKEKKEKEEKAKEIGIDEKREKIEEVVDENKFVPDQKKVEVPGMRIVLFPTDEFGQTGYKEYLVYDNLRDAHFYSPSLPIHTNPFTIKGYKSIKFEKDENGFYKVNYDVEYVRAIHLTPGIAKATGLDEIILKNGTIAVKKVSSEPSFSHICLYLDVLCPIFCGLEKETIFGVVPMSSGNGPLTFKNNQTVYIKLNLSHIDTMKIELKDLFGNPIHGDNASGHLWLEFIKK